MQIAFRQTQQIKKKNDFKIRSTLPKNVSLQSTLRSTTKKSGTNKFLSEMQKKLYLT